MLQPFCRRLSQFAISAFLILSVMIKAHGSQQIVIRVPPQEVSNASHTDYILQLLEQALEHSKAKGETITLRQIPEIHTEARMIAELVKGQSLDLIWTMTSKEREAQMRPIRIPLLKGLLGHRVFLIRHGDQKKFSAIKSLDNLKTLMAARVATGPTPPSFAIAT
jgi:hypothetical protein